MITLFCRTPSRAEVQRRGGEAIMAFHHVTAPGQRVIVVNRKGLKLISPGQREEPSQATLPLWTRSSVRAVNNPRDDQRRSI